MCRWSFIITRYRNLVHDNRPSISTYVSADSIHTAGVVDNEADSEADSNDDTYQYLSSINQIYELIFQLLAMIIAQDPGRCLLIGRSLSQKLDRTFDPNRLSKAT